MLRAGAAPPHEEALHDLARLPVDERAALLLAEDGELTPDEIARVLGVPDDRAEAMVVRARNSLDRTAPAADRRVLGGAGGAGPAAGRAPCRARRCAATCATARAVAAIASRSGASTRR